ncbi:MAG: dsDNA nuclease domain-containing protein, partial [Nitrososphaeraceae archaeon]
MPSPENDADRVPDDHPISDGGDVSQRGFAYQHSYTCIIAIEMYVGRLSYLELLCELEGDILAKRKDGDYDIYQVKTKNHGSFSWNDDEIRSSISKFIKMERKYQNVITKYIIVTNCGIREDPALNKSMLLGYSEGSGRKRRPTYFFNYMMENVGAGPYEVVNVLKKVESGSDSQGPRIEDIDSKIISDHLTKLPEVIGKSVSYDSLVRVSRLLRNMIYDASSKKIEGSFDIVKAFVSDYDRKQSKVELDSKRITIDKIKEIIKNLVILDEMYDVQINECLSRLGGKLVTNSSSFRTPNKNCWKVAHFTDAEIKEGYDARRDITDDILGSLEKNRGTIILARSHYGKTTLLRRIMFEKILMGYNVLYMEELNNTSINLLRTLVQNVNKKYKSSKLIIIGDNMQKRGNVKMFEFF